MFSNCARDSFTKMMMMWVEFVNGKSKRFKIELYIFLFEFQSFNQIIKCLWVREIQKNEIWYTSHDDDDENLFNWKKMKKNVESMSELSYLGGKWFQRDEKQKLLRGGVKSWLENLSRLIFGNLLHCDGCCWW